MTNTPSFEITDQGVISPSYAEILTGILEDINQAFGGTLNKDVTTPQGQLGVSMAASVNEKNTQLLYLINQFNPNFAQGRFQDALASIYFLQRTPARGTSVLCHCTGKAGSTIPKGSRAIDNNGYIYVLESSIKLDSKGKGSGVFVNTTTGGISCSAGSLNTIYEAVEGWDSVNNPNAGSLGQDVESRNNFEQRRRSSVALNSQNQNLSIQSSLLSTTDVIDAYVYSNDTGEAITHGVTNYPIAPHSLMISVYGGDSATIAQLIFDKKNPGCGMVGNTTQKIVIKDGYSEPFPTYKITYLVPTPKDIKFKITIEKSDLLPADIETQIQEAVIDIFTGSDGKSRARIGGTIHTGRYYTPISNLSDYVNIESISISKDGENYSSSITMGVDEMPVLSQNDIEVIS